MNFANILRQAYEQAPDLPILHLLSSGAPDLPVTYRDLLHGAAGYARALEEAGVQPGEVTILILQHGADLVYAFFGAVLHGSIPSIMPFLTEKLDPALYRQSLAALFEITQPGAVITYAEFLPELKAAQASNGEGNVKPAILVSQQIEAWPAPDFGQLAGLERDAEEIVLLQHSSGTTGLQKGVALSHQAVFNQIESYARAIQLDPLRDVVVSWLPLYHDMGLIAGFIMPILSRTPLVLMSPFDWVRAPYRLFQAVSSYGGTLTWLPNFAYNFCAQKVRDRDLEMVDLSSWRAVINCSEPMHWESHQMFQERFTPYGLRPEALATCYAMAENVFAVTQGGIRQPVRVDYVERQALLTEQVAHPAPPSGDHALPLLSAGAPIDNTRLRVVDAHGRDLPERHLGEIALRSDCMLSGYYHRPDLTDKAFLDGWYLTGDLGYLADHQLYVTGRKKDLIIVGGKNVYPQDLERLAANTPGVYPGRLVAFGIDNPSLGTEDVVIVAESEENDAARRREIAAEIRRRVTRGSDVALRFVEIVDRNWLVKTSSGKIARQANRARYLAQFQ